jgi:hypothetical protein
MAIGSARGEAGSEFVMYVETSHSDTPKDARQVTIAERASIPSKRPSIFSPWREAFIDATGRRENQVIDSICVIWISFQRKVTVTSKEEILF